MSIRIKRSLLVLLFSALLLCGLSRYEAITLRQTHGSVGLRYREPILLLAQVQELEREQQATQEPPDAYLTLWDKEEAQAVENAGTGLTKNLAVFRFYGDMSTVMESAFFDGHFPYRADNTGCVLDADAAHALFGATDVVGKTVLWQSKEYLIRGVLKGRGGVLLVQEDDPDAAYRHLEMTLSAPESAEAQAFSYLAEHGLPTPDAVIDGYAAADLADIASHLPLWTACFCLILHLAKELWRRRRKPVLFIMGLLGLITLAGLLGQAAGFPPAVPERFVPTQWSDFSFYSNQWNRIIENRRALQQLYPVAKDRALDRQMLFCLLSAAAASVLFCRWFILLLGKHRFSQYTGGKKGDDSMGDLAKLQNIGKVLEQQLQQIGIETPEQLRRTGSKEAWLQIKAVDPSACYNRLCALEGAVQGVRWHTLPDPVKADLKTFYNAHHQ